MLVSISRLSSGDVFQAPGVAKLYTLLAKALVNGSVHVAVAGRQKPLVMARGQLVKVKELPYKGFAKR